MASAGGKHRSECHEIKPIQSLELSSQQREAIDDIKSKYRLNESKSEKRYKDSSEIKKLMQEEAFDESGIRKALDNQSQKRIDRMVKKLKVKHEINKVLNNEQKSKLKEMKNSC